MCALHSRRPATHRTTRNKLLGAEARNRQDEALGSVHDLVTSPQSGKIAYLVISRGRILGIDEKYVAVPCEY